jgi:hypothetical protein
MPDFLAVAASILSGWRQFIRLAPKPEQHFRRLLVNLDLKVVCVDVHVRNDGVGWDDYVRRVKK